FIIFLFSGNSLSTQYSSAARETAATRSCIFLQCPLDRKCSIITVAWLSVFSHESQMKLRDFSSGNLEKRSCAFCRIAPASICPRMERILSRALSYEIASFESGRHSWKMLV
ncbi:hypothetical protein PENTCL1PPCAC_7, partial [Pristionchus entomophagus]